MIGDFEARSTALLLEVSIVSSNLSTDPVAAREANEHKQTQMCKDFENGRIGS